MCYGSKAAFTCALEVFGADHLVTGSDYPVLQWLARSLPLAPLPRERIVPCPIAVIRRRLNDPSA